MNEQAGESVPTHQRLIRLPIEPDRAGLSEQMGKPYSVWVNPAQVSYLQPHRSRPDDRTDLWMANPTHCLYVALPFADVLRLLP